jgi:hypothetical protein
MTKMETKQQGLEAKVEASNEKLEAVQENMWTSEKEMKPRIGALVPRMDVNHEDMEPD